MSVEADIADALLDTLKQCVPNCELYDRFPVTAGDPPIECSTLGIGLQNFPPAAQVANCEVYVLNLNVVVAQCCYPVGGADGSPPSADAVTAATRCLTDDVEAILCCIKQISIDVVGIVKDCRPKISSGVTYSRPEGACVVAKIGVSIPGVPCCGN